ARRPGRDGQRGTQPPGRGWRAMTLETPRRTDPAEDVAIVGMACVFPGADSLSRFWQNIVNKVDCVTDPPPGWRPERYCGADGRASEPVYTGKGGYLGDVCRFNPAKYGVVPSSLDGAEPDQFLALRCAHEALLDAGVAELPLNRAKTGIILGRGLYHNR